MYFHNKVQIYLNITFQITYRNSYAPKYTDGQIAFSFQLETYIKFIHKYHIITNHNNNNKILFPLPNMMKFKVFFLSNSENYAPHSPLCFHEYDLFFFSHFHIVVFVVFVVVVVFVAWIQSNDAGQGTIKYTIWIHSFRLLYFSTDIVCFVSNKI